MEKDILYTLRFQINHQTLYEDAATKLRWFIKKSKDEKDIVLPKHIESETFEVLTYLSYISTTQLDLIKHHT